MSSAFEETIRPWLGALQARHGTYVILPDGSQTTDIPPRLQRLLDARQRSVSWIVDRADRRLRNILEDHRIERGPANHTRLGNALRFMQESMTLESTGSAHTTGWFGEYERIPALLDGPERDAAYRIADLLSETRREVDGLVFAPGATTFDEFSADGLERLLDPSRYHVSERDPNVFRSSNVRSVGQPYGFKAKTSCALQSDGVVLKNFVFGTSCGEHRDKWDLVVRMDAQGVREILHPEYDMAGSLALLQRSVNPSIDRVQQRLPSTSRWTLRAAVGSPEGNWLLNRYAARGAELMFGVTGHEVKTASDGEQFSHVLHAGEARSRTRVDLRRSISNYDELCRDPYLLGGPALETAVGFVRENYDRLVDLYARLRAGN